MFFSKVTSTGSAPMPDAGMPQARAPDQRNVFQRALQSVLIRFTSAKAARCAQMPRSSSLLVTVVVAAPCVVFRNDDAARVSAPRAGANHRAGLLVADAIGYPDQDIHAVTSPVDSGKGTAIRWNAYSLEFRLLYPKCLGYCEYGIFVEGPDRKPRRFPFDKGGLFFPIPNGCEAIGRSFVLQIDRIYDAPRNSIHRVIAEYAIDELAGTVAFVVEGVAVPSVLADLAVYVLPNGKCMIAQTEIRGCSYACVEMLLAEGKSRSELLRQLSRASCSIREQNGRSRRETAEMWRSLEEQSGRKSVVIEGDALKPADAIQKLKQGIAAFGPCIFSIDGHARILDEIKQSARGPVVTLRDPFCASVLEIDASEIFRPFGVNGLADSSWEAIFLPEI
ncbi:hypothetical protein [Bordetella sp. LUAb4]|uniref:hypothetical protein n=1 Tax=Bordetella sp. LUAb4 TaxID=2843195 RepID=UPI001E387D21|nr:hypothetical protein [Bordetella sp. LUAb4]